MLKHVIKTQYLCVSVGFGHVVFKEFKCDKKVALKQESLGENVEILGPNPNWNDKFIEFCPCKRRKNINLMKLGAIEIEIRIDFKE